ncbi:MAG: hypothetical protein QHJ82_05460 [Verrucomicrobiota bacterium]|nr:hypothetical protein [Verrucomicrobiota bacterium]
MKRPSSEFKLVFPVIMALFCAQQSQGQLVIRQSHVVTTVQNEGGGVYRYEYELFNDSPGAQPPDGMCWPAIIGYEVPLDSPSVVWDITWPDTWYYWFLSAEQYELEYGTVNPFNSAYVLQWYDYQLTEKMIVPTNFNLTFETDHYEPSASGFGFRSYLAPVDGPYAAVWLDFYRNVGDPPLPGGSLSGGALPYQPVPEVPSQMPAGIACMGIAVLCARRRTRSSALSVSGSS